MKFILNISIIIFLTVSAYGQVGNHEKPLRLNISYFGEFVTHPGIKLGAEYPLALRVKEKIGSKGKQKRREHLLFTGGNLGFYRHKRNHFGAFLNAELGYRKTRTKGFKTEGAIGIGYFRTFLDGRTYEVKDNGEVETIKLAGRNKLMYSFSFGIGKDLYQKYQVPISWIVKPTLFVETPYNNGFLPHFALELGVSYLIVK
jgi:hypothetical protein